MEKKTIGSFISALRRAKGWTQRDLAEQLNVSDKAVSRWERDESAPDLSLLPLIADLFEITVDELLRGQRRFPAPELPTADDTQEDNAARTDPGAQKRQRLLLENRRRRHKTFNYISVGLALGGMMIALICNFGFYRATIAFFLGVSFEIAAVICALIFASSALPVSDEGYDATLLSDYRRDVLRCTYRTCFLVALLTGPLLLLLIVGISYGSYVGAAAASFFPNCALWLIFGGSLLWELGRLLILPRIYRNNGVTLSEVECARTRDGIRLLRRCALSLVLALILPVFTLGIMNCGIIDQDSAFADGQTFDDFEVFRTYIEQEGDPNADHPSSRSMRYALGASSYAYIDRIGALADGAQEEEFYSDDWGYSHNQEPVEEVRIDEDGYFSSTFSDEYAIYSRKDGEEITRFCWRNPEVICIHWSFTNNALGTPITVYTLQDRSQSQHTAAIINISLSLLMIVETACVLGVYLVKRKRILK